MNPEDFVDELIRVGAQSDVLEKRFDRHLTQIESALNKLDDKISNLSQVVIGAEKTLTEKHFHTNDRIVKLESQHGFLAKAVQAVLATITGGLAGWLARHS